MRTILEADGSTSYQIEGTPDQLDEMAASIEADRYMERYPAWSMSWDRYQRNHAAVKADALAARRDGRLQT